MGQDSLIALGESAVRKSIEIYESWLERFETDGPAGTREKVQADFMHGLDTGEPGQAESYVQNRVREIKEALEETPRRLSVSYTNLGLVYRYREDYTEAASCYRKAMDLWEDNLTAENNLNILLGKPLKKRNFLQKMFPRPKS
jgi:tetratricopeptide (TPR) repeat protein